MDYVCIHACVRASWTAAAGAWEAKKKEEGARAGDEATRQRGGKEEREEREEKTETTEVR